MEAIFRENDIRGIADVDLTAAMVRSIGHAIGSLAAERGERRIAVARDGRLSSPQLCEALKAGIKATGRHVIDLGAVPTPVLYYATQVLDTRAGVMVTGSHNPPEYNGLKVVIDGVALHGKVIRDLRERIDQGKLHRGRGGEQREDLRDAYLNQICTQLALAHPLKVAVDCGNGIAGELAPKLLRALGCEVVELHCQVDGRFPHHHPDPSQPENLAELCANVLALSADVGLAFDGDADRLGLITDEGEIIWPDQLMMPMVQSVLKKNPGARIVYDVKCTHHLARLIIQHGGVPLMWKTGHALIKERMRKTGALFGGEMSGHFIHADSWFCFDDALYSAARLLSILAQDRRSVANQFSDHAVGISTPELRIPMREGEPFTFMKKFLERANFGPCRLITVDGLRVEFEQGWGLVRASQTTPNLTLRFEADDAHALAQIQALFRRELLAIQPLLSLPF